MKPIILLGAGRSGTKFLRSVLASSNDVVAVPYDVGYVWRYGNERVDHDQLTANLLNDKIKKYVHKALPLLADTSLKPNATFFIEKSVPNTLRPEYIYQIFPDAKFIHLIRDGRAVVESSMRMWREPTNKTYLLKKLRYFPWANYRYAWWYLINFIKGSIGSSPAQQIWGPRYKGMDEDVRTLPLATVCARQWRHCVEIGRGQLSVVPASQVLEIRYEDLMSDVSQLERACEFIGVSDKAAVINYFISHVEKNNNKEWKVSLITTDLELILDEAGVLLTQLGYTNCKGQPHD